VGVSAPGIDFLKGFAKSHWVWICVNAGNGAGGFGQVVH
jgi:hypothetical protein